MKLLIINGPNINMLGIREPGVYGTDSYQDLLQLIETTAAKNHIEYKHFQSNHEGAIIDEIQAAYGQFDGIVINPAGYTHTSVAILDALKAVSIPAVEVHISKVNQREAFRQVSYPGMYCELTIKGKGIAGYQEAILYLNPVVLEESEETCEYSEGCLSVPGIYAEVRRPSKIKVEYYNEKLEKVVEEFDRFGCRMVQHELSHLDGNLFVDNVTPIRRKMIARKLQAIAKGSVQTRYKSKR